MSRLYQACSETFDDFRRNPHLNLVNEKSLQILNLQAFLFVFVAQELQLSNTFHEDLILLANLNGDFET